MTTWEYRTDILPFQPGPVARDDKGQLASGLTTHLLCAIGAEGWELVSVLQAAVPTAQIAVAQGGAEMPPVQPALFCVFKRAKEGA